ncbi:Uncharacterised protein [Yersinia bercovieri]|nr:Uncharacterised protein [Yersinia bercovieri]
MFTAGVAITIICTDLVAGLYGIQQPVATGIDLKILADIEARALHDKVTITVDHRIIGDINTRQRPEDGLIAQHCAIAAELFTISAQYQITAAIQLQIGGI